MEAVALTNSHVFVPVVVRHANVSPVEKQLNARRRSVVQRVRGQRCPASATSMNARLLVIRCSTCLTLFIIHQPQFGIRHRPVVGRFWS